MLEVADAHNVYEEAKTGRVEAQVEQAHAQVAQARKGRSNVEVRPPINSVVIERIRAGHAQKIPFDSEAHNLRTPAGSRADKEPG